jgi:localization factor PodJL
VALAPPTGAPSGIGAPGDKPAASPEADKPPVTDKPETDSAGPSQLPERIGSVKLRTAAANGDPRAQFEIAARFTEGRGVPQNLEEAAQWYKRAAEQGLAPAQYRLGSLYEKGKGVAKDPRQAQTWYERAATAGNAKAMHNLAVLYAEGATGTPDFAEAARWFRKAAELGVRDSQFNLAILHARGLGVPRDLAASYKWFAIAAREGDQDSARKRDEIANALDRQRLAAARLAAETWKPAKRDPEANEVIPPEGGWGAAPARSATVGDTGNLVSQAQALLAKLGFDAGPPDGVAGPKTRDAVRAFQRQEGLPVTGEIDANLVHALAGRAI